MRDYSAGQIAARDKQKGVRMPIYELDGERPELPAEGQYWLAETAVLIGRVRLLRNANVWYGSTLRGDNEWIELGEGSNIQENCTLHTDMGFPLTIARSCTIGHNVILHGCSIGENSLVGMGATLLNGARIGKNCLVGAGALVTEGKEFPENSLIVGSPARAIRSFDEKAAKAVSFAADWYVKRWIQYAKGLKKIG
jgi:carbonic anhydrase/acetyltransferase-like protein (isoleucine patch superfamily)